MRTQSLYRKLDALRRDVLREAGQVRDKRRPPPPSAGSRVSLRRVLLAALKIAAVVTLPFIVYVRASVWLYLDGELNAWSAVAGAAAITLGIVAVYSIWLSRRFSPAGRARAGFVVRWIALPVALAWCGYAALYLSRVNAKSDEVRRYYASVHPVLRVALATAILGDPGIVVTDARRVAADYPRMGLPVFDRSAHFRQANGWVHAVDLRTLGSGETRNRAMQLYFAAMGFGTLRHVGTADHLHVQLAVRR